MLLVGCQPAGKATGRYARMKPPQPVPAKHTASLPITDDIEAMPSVAVILVNYGAIETTMACIRSLQHLAYSASALSIWVVDNGSTPPQQLTLDDVSGPFAVHTIRCEVNNGFSAGNNIALRELRALPHPPDLVWLLNNDALVFPDTLHHLVQCSQQQPVPSLIGGIICHPDGEFQQVATQINLWTGSSKGYSLTEALETQQVDSLSGACMLAPFSVIERIGLMPEHYFLYFEDVAYCLMAKQAGIPCKVTALANVSHVMGCTTNAIPEKRSYYYHRNRWLVCWTFAHILQRMTLVSYGIFRLVRSMVKAKLDPAMQREHLVLWLALCDAITGVTGPCPHPQLK
jgi:N-acetylglucosaminyl-diphospho-decaprenol L-rhamnosyltransferase